MPPITEPAVVGNDPPPGPDADDISHRYSWKRGVRNAIVLGVLAIATAVLLNGTTIAAITETLHDLPTALAISAAVHIPQIVMTAIAWSVLLPGHLRLSTGTMSLIRWFRESAGTLLPAGGLVGQIAAARSLTRWGVPGELAGATATVDLTLEAVSQVLFTLAGLALLLDSSRPGSIRNIAALGTAVSAGCALALLTSHWLLRQRWMERQFNRLASRWPTLPLNGVRAVFRAVVDLHARPHVLAGALCCHSAAWALGAVEIVGVLDLLGQPIDLGDGLIIESMAQALRNAGFMLPGAVGVQEGALVGAAALVGVPPVAALTVALVRRTREVLMSLAGLLAWHRSEMTWRAAMVPAPMDPPTT